MKKIMVLTILIILTPAFVYGLSVNISLYRDSGRVIPDNLPWYPLVVFGDNRPDNIHAIKYSNVFYRMMREMEVINPLAVIGTGDHTGTGSKEQIDYFIETMSRFDNVWACLGNHDLINGELNYWIENVAPEYYYIDNIPGWRIVFINSEDSDIQRLRLITEDMLKDTNRSIILVVHRPLYPNVEHNLWDRGGEFFQSIIQLVNRYNVKLVLQGHWHGFASQKINGVEYIITAGAGAPLYYKPSAVENATVVTGKHHYMILILYPNGEYTYTPVDVSAGNIEVRRLNETTILIHNTKLDLWSEYIKLPIRVNITVYNETYNVVLMANPGYTILSYTVSKGKIMIRTNSTNWYIYNNPGKNSNIAMVPEIATAIQRKQVLATLMATVVEASAIAILIIYLQKQRRI